MKRFLGSLVLLAAVAVLAGCGDEPDGRADDPVTEARSDPPTDEQDEPSPDEPSPGDPEVVDIVSGSAVGPADVSRRATVIRDDAGLERYLRQFDSAPFVADLEAAAETVEIGEDRVLGLAVIEISCDEPPSAEVTQVGGRFLVTAGKVVSPHQECFAPVTSVAVLDLPA